MGRVIGEQVSCSLAWLSNESTAREQDGSTAVARPMYLILPMYWYIPIGILHWSMLCAYARNPVTHNHVVVAFVICIVLYCIVMYVLYHFVFLIIKKRKKDGIHLNRLHGFCYTYCCVCRIQTPLLFPLVCLYTHLRKYKPYGKRMNTVSITN